MRVGHLCQEISFILLILALPGKVICFRPALWNNEPEVRCTSRRDDCHRSSWLWNVSKTIFYRADEGVLFLMSFFLRYLVNLFDDQT